MTDLDKLIQLVSADTISDEQLAAYIDGNATKEEQIQVYSALQCEDPLINESVATIIDINNLQNDIMAMDPNVIMKDEYVGDINPYLQTHDDTCAIKAQQIILSDFGIQCTEDELLQYSIEHGWYNEGTAPAHVGNLLEVANIPVTRQSHANVFNLIDELSQGHKVIVGVDSDELWYNDSIGGKIKNWLSDFFGERPNHALIVAGIDTRDPNNIQVIVTDPGPGDYHKSYPLEQFMDAWADSGCFMVSTDISVPNTVAGMENFNPEIGHIDNVAGIPYSNFQMFNEMSYGLPIYAPMDMGYCCPMDSFTQAYFDYANGNIHSFADIFGQNYMFNNYLDPNVITPMLHNMYNQGLAQINFDPMNDWNNYALVNHIPVMTNEAYSDFLSHSIDNFMALGDIQSAMYCQQQQMMMDYGNHFECDYDASIINYDDMIV